MHFSSKFPHLVRLIRARSAAEAVRKVYGKSLLRQLHWLPVRERISYKVALLTYKAHIMSSPDYLARLLQRHVPTRSLRSSVAPLLLVPRTQANIGKRASSVAAPLTWNALPNYTFAKVTAWPSSNQDWKPHCSQLPLTLGRNITSPSACTHPA